MEREQAIALLKKNRGVMRDSLHKELREDILKEAVQAA
jgi:hypothetical protein